MSKQNHHYYVYIVASRSHVLYCGMTDSIQRRAEEHREGGVAGFTTTYQCNRLVWFEHHQYVNNAIGREIKSSVGDERRRYGSSNERTPLGPT
jgi:putative endonuclease